jgi:hypothetical protein
VGDGNVGYGDASRKGQEDVPAGFDPGAGTCGRVASAPGKAREAAEGGFLGGGDAFPVHYTAQNPFRDVMEQRGMCSEGRAPHSVVSLGGAKGGAAVALHGRGVGGQHAEAEAAAGVGADFPALEFKSRSAGESVEPGGGGATGAAKQARARAPPLHTVGIVGLVERVETGLGLVPCEDALGLGDVARELGVDLLQLGLPEVSRLAIQGLPLGPEHLAAGPVQRPERLWVAAHIVMRGGGGCEVRRSAERRAGAGET